MAYLHGISKGWDGRLKSNKQDLNQRSMAYLHGISKGWDGRLKSNNLVEGG